jgi:hypothetical protein
MSGVWALVLVLEALALRFGQRRLFGAAQEVTRSRLVAYALAAPGTVLHESAHYIMALALGVPAGDRVRRADGSRARVSFFWPRPGEDGSVTLGSVPLAATDPLRGALVAVAPLLLVPPLFAGLTFLLLPVHALSGLGDAFVAAPLWREMLWAYLAFSCSQAAFPSTGDHVGVLGAVGLIFVGGLVVVALASSHDLTPALSGICTLLAVPAALSGLSLAVFESWRRRPARGRGRDRAIAP